MAALVLLALVFYAQAVSDHGTAQMTLLYPQARTVLELPPAPAPVLTVWGVPVAPPLRAE